MDMCEYAVWEGEELVWLLAEVLNEIRERDKHGNMDVRYNIRTCADGEVIERVHPVLIREVQQ